MPAIDLSILNQRQTPAFYADTLANRPAAGFIGRIFVSTNTFAFFRDNGTGWDLIGGPGTGTVTGSGAAGQVSFWNGANTITGSNDLFWDNVNGHLGVGTVTPGTALDVKHDQSTVVQLEQVTATNDIRIAFINSGVGLWRLGAFYNAGANDFGLFDIAAATQPVTVKRTTGQVLIGTSTVGSGKLVVASATSDNGIQIVGANAPSLRIDSAESGPTKRAGFGISTATNNFIQGSADRDFCMFNGSTTASPILFGIYDAAAVNVQEAARISAARNFLIGTTTDGGYKLSVNGTGYINDRLIIDGTTTSQYIQFYSSGVDKAHIYWDQGLNGLSIGTYVSGGQIQFETNNNVDAMIITSAGYVGIGITTPTELLHLSTTLAGSTGVGTSLQITSGGAGGDQAWIGVNKGIGNGLEFSVENRDIIFNTGATTSFGGTERLRIISAGNVGIGTSTPYNPDGATEISTDINSAGLVASLYVTSNQGNLVRGIFTSNTFTDLVYIGSSSNHPVGFLVGASEKARIATTGNFLINTQTDAGYKLDVNGGSVAIRAGGGHLSLFRTSFNTFEFGTGIASGISGLVISDSTAGINPLIIAQTTGNATFSGSIAIGNSVAGAIAAPSTHKVSIIIGGVQYYLLASNV